MAYVIALLAVGAAFLLRLGLDPYLKEEYPFVFFFGAIAVAGLSGRPGSAFVAALLGFLLADFFFIPPRHTLVFTTLNSMHLLGALSYWLTAGGMILISSATHVYASRAQQLAGALERSQAEFRDQFELAPIGAFQITPDGRFLLTNPHFREVTGFTEEEQQNQTLLDITHPEDRLESQRLLERLLRHEIPAFALEKRLLRKNGKSVWVRCTLGVRQNQNGQPERFIGFTEDISGRKEAETALREALGLQQLIVESARDFAIEIVSPEGVIQQWNPGAEKIFGYPASEAVGHKTDLIFTPEDRAAGMAAKELKSALENSCALNERWHQRKDGLRVFISGTVRPLYTGEKVLRGFLKIGRNITERKRMEEELKEARENLERLVTNRTASLQETVQQLEQFSYSLFHDLRGPLRSMCSFAQLLQADYSGKLDEQGNEYLARIARAAKRMDNLIRDVLSYRKLSAEPATLSRVDLESLLQQIVAENIPFQPPASRVELDTPLLPVRGHEALLTQCIWNLLSNAVKFVPRDRSPVVRVWTEKRGEQVRIWFEDNGIGIDPSHADRIFGMFERLHADAQYPGTGIGLAIVRKAAERMDGLVGVESEPGRGSRFWLQLHG